MPWLLRDEEVLAALEVADSRSSRRKGLLGRDTIDGALLLRPARSVHTVGMRFPIDVAFCDAEMTVVATACMARHRIGRPRLRARSVIEAEAGAFERWRLAVGDRLEVRE
ncbi:MAG TPA: DUF192 domain-containing protein [Acidimicrobiales bacterium]|nr:DUF192 domain-containing protein [Acidimicrobiales bacterium]